MKRDRIDIILIWFFNISILFANAIEAFLQDYGSRWYLYIYNPCFPSWAKRFGDFFLKTKLFSLFFR